MSAPRTRLGSSSIEVYPLSLGGNVFGWTADEAQSFAVLDGYADAGGNFIDTADGYSHWVPGNHGGESERVIGRWLSHRTDRDAFVIATKVASHPDFKGLAPSNVKAAADASLGRLQVDHIDLYYAHFDDHTIPLADTVGALSELVDAGKVRAIAISNYSPERIDEWFEVTERDGLHRAVALQPHYNLVERTFEDDLRERAERHGLGVVPYYSLAAGFLTGKYRDGIQVDSARAAGAGRYLDDRGRRVLETLDEVAAAHGASVASVALAWLRDQPTVVAPIASARTPEQLQDLIASVTLELTDDELGALTDASATQEDEAA
ncbi:aldo/keto reductase [Humibacter sp. RRB41]|uniref:aldo/keto reductase n=1 Tax=Humibacter sp. RRB41 TaxID=2919946 RepID=UPI001FA9AD2F|nr:aldo/keto reductase [Humibacter sp. RRB41]